MSPQLISRRSTFTGLAVSVVGGVAGYVFGRNSSAAKDKSDTTAANSYGASTSTTTGSTSGSSGGTLLAPLAQIPSGGGVILTKSKIVLTKGSDGTVHGFSAVCTHQGCTVDKISGGVISCPCHGSRYDAQTGAVVGGPAPAPLAKVAVVVRGTDVFSG
ncbi:MAG TPA: Rieske (2Fe-2S) protein [Frankiaceae bacterium]|nr:Rieske (2Fe-2S) protein [Frankiaceae bacterium]